MPVRFVTVVLTDEQCNLDEEKNEVVVKLRGKDIYRVHL